MSHWKTYLQRSNQVLSKTLSNIILMKGADSFTSAARTLYSFNTPADIKQFATGCDGDIGGLSTVHFDLDERPEINKSIGKAGTGMFWGDMKTQVKPGMEKKIRGGYAGFRNKTRPTFFGNMLEDVSGYDYIALRLRIAGDPRTHNSYFVNIQTDGPISTDLWQHRLYFRRQDNTWEDVFIPFNSFVRTNLGEMSINQMGMLREKVRSVGISMLGGNSGVEGKYELGIDSIRVVNEDDVVLDHVPLAKKAEAEDPETSQESQQRNLD